MMPESTKKTYTPSETLEEGFTYVSVPEHNCVLGVKISVTKVLVEKNSDGSVKLDAEGLPSLFWSGTNVVKILSNKEYEVEKQRKLRK